MKYLKPGIKTFDKTIDSKAATTNGVKKIVDDAVICAGASTKGFAQSFIPVITYYKACQKMDCINPPCLQRPKNRSNIKI